MRWVSPNCWSCATARLRSSSSRRSKYLSSGSPQPDFLSPDFLSPDFPSPWNCVSMTHLVCFGGERGRARAVRDDDSRGVVNALMFQCTRTPDCHENLKAHSGPHGRVDRAGARLLDQTARLHQDDGGSARRTAGV